MERPLHGNDVEMIDNLKRLMSANEFIEILKTRII